MSLKAKIEAVIYASEEPVTLSQLTGLLGEEGQFELDELAANQLSLDTSSLDGDEDALNAEVLDPAEVDLSDEAVIPSDGEVAGENAAGNSEEGTSGDGTSGDGAAAESKDAKAEQKLAARKLRDHFRTLLDQLIADYANGDRGLEIREVASGYRLATKPEYHDAVRGFVKSLKPPIKLTLQALETLAVIAYKQPVTAPEISEIRGVDSSGVLGSLMARKLVTTAGRKQVIGRPILYKTTKDFLLRFGLKDINELPSIEEFEKMAGELNDTLLDQVPVAEQEEGTQEEETMDETQTDETTRPRVPEDAGEPPALDELNAAPEPTHVLHDTTADLMSDKSTRPEGHKHEPAEDSHADSQADSQADGTSEE